MSITCQNIAASNIDDSDTTLSSLMNVITMMADSIPKLNDSSLYDNLKGEWLSSKGLLVLNQNGSLSFNGQTHNLVTYDLLPNNIWRFGNGSSVWGLIKNNSLFVTNNGKNYNFFRSLPSAPTRLVATAGYGYVDLSWSAPSFDGGPSVAGYKIYVNGSTNPILTSETSKRIENLAAGTLYTFVVSAETDVGESQKSESASATPLPLPPPANLVASAGDGFVDLSWNAPSLGPNVLEYRIYVNGNYNTSISTTSKRISSLTNNVSYSFSVSAVSSIGESNSSSVSATPAKPLVITLSRILNEGESIIVYGKYNNPSPSDILATFSHYIVYLDGVEYITSMQSWSVFAYDGNTSGFMARVYINYAVGSSHTVSMKFKRKDGTYTSQSETKTFITPTQYTNYNF